MDRTRQPSTQDLREWPTAKADANVVVKTDSGKWKTPREQLSRCESDYIDRALDPNWVKRDKKGHPKLHIRGDAEIVRQALVCMRQHSYDAPSNWSSAQQKELTEVFDFLGPRPLIAAAAASEAAAVAAIAAAKAIPPGYVRIEAGESHLGSPAREAGRCDYEEVEVVARVTRPYLFKADKVIQGEYAAVMGHNPSHFTTDLPDGGLASQCPVEQVSFYHGLAFCNALSVRDGLRPCYDLGGWTGRADAGDDHVPATVVWDESAYGYRLPTVAEFVRAARAGTTGATYIADQDRRTIAHYSAERTRPVGQEAPNAWGVRPYGNVFTWAWDWYQPQQLGGDDPKGPATGSARVLVGGSWYSYGYCVRAAFRDNAAPWVRCNSVGLCLARSVLD